MKNLTNIFISILAIAYLFIVLKVVRDSCYNSSVVKDISLITTSFFTLIIALLLYDRFNYRKVIFERKLDIVLKLLENLKSTRIFVNYINIDHGKRFGGWMMINKKEINFVNDSINPTANVVFEIQELDTYFKEISLFRSNPFMPKEIVKTLEFLSITYLESVDSLPNYVNEHVKLSINKKSKNIKDIESWNKTINNIKFKDFTDNYLKCLVAIEIWINKHSNFKSDLNI